MQATVERVGNAGPTPTGTVSITKAAGSVVGTAVLDNGKASIPLPADLPVGVHTLVATYSGDASVGTATANVTVTVKAATTPPPVKKAPPPTPRRRCGLIRLGSARTCGSR